MKPNFPAILALVLLPIVAAAQGDSSSIKNFFRVNEQICTGGQPTMEELARLKATGVKAIINLRMASEFNAEEEAAKAGELGLRYIHIPVNSNDLKDASVEEFLKATSDAENRPAFIHCTTANRVGAFWLIRGVVMDNWKLEDATAEAEKIGVRTPVMREFALGYIRRQAAFQEASNIRNFLRVNENFCTGGQPRLEQLTALKAAGVKTILNLRTPGEHRAEEEEAAAKQVGLRYINLPVVYSSPKEEGATEFLRITDDPENRPTFIHCTAAIRVASFWLIRRVLRDGWSFEAAEAEAAKISPDWAHGAHLLEFARTYIQKHPKQ